ncbi:protein farnesyltransferase subunit beta isoform X2 [Argentina anserina]|uniref:protein farnesyltransferase subunit beta isoform X2 n=1 Tax=Argentina anserina TaxID=57926 RepID=UPI0021766D31|nr:protein farnesyltransferase subunit beta isoform X2 [Potentilla anserina]
MLTDHGCVTGFYTHWLYLGNQWRMIWRIEPLTSLTFVRTRMVDMVVDLDRRVTSLIHMPHLATTYAAVNALITLADHEALSSINRHELYKFLRRMKQPNGGFRMHDAGEIDVRASYTAISTASLLNILDHELVDNVGNYILSCQTYEGGISGEPGSEAHGGYTFCGLATMILIDEVNRLDLSRLIDWLVFRHGIELGFQGRTNKLVDGCYSFWQGGAFALLQRIPSVREEQTELPDARCRTSHSSKTSHISEVDKIYEGTSSQVDVAGAFRQEGLNIPSPVNYNDIGYDFINRSLKMEPLFNSVALQQYILLCTQAENGGLRDKPGKNQDFYHTCYCLSGLSVCQHMGSDVNSPVPNAVAGPYSNLLEPIHPLFNVVLDKYHEAREFFTTP